MLMIEENGLERFRQQMKAEKEAAILRAATSLFYVHGLHAVSMQKIADHAKCSSATVYAHFKSKDDLLGACIERIAGPDIGIGTDYEMPAFPERTRRANLFMRRVADNELRNVVLLPERAIARKLLQQYLEDSLKAYQVSGHSSEG